MPEHNQTTNNATPVTPQSKGRVNAKNNGLGDSFADE